MYEDWKSDKSYKKREEGKMPKSKATEAYERMYGKKDSEDMAEDGATKALAEKAKKSGIPLGVLRKVYERGMARRSQTGRIATAMGYGPCQFVHHRLWWCAQGRRRPLEAREEVVRCTGGRRGKR